MKVSALIVSKDTAEEMCRHEDFARLEKDLHVEVKRLGFIAGIPLYLDPLLKPGEIFINHTKDYADEDRNYIPFEEGCALL